MRVFSPSDSRGTAVHKQSGCTSSSAICTVKPKYAPDNLQSSRNTAIHKPPLWPVDMSINKTTQITEKLSFQSRDEAQNIFKNTVADTNSTLPRGIQLGGKVVW